MGSRLETNSKSVQKKIESHAFHDERGEEYEGSAFGGFADYFRRKRIKLQNLDAETRAQSAGNAQIFSGVVVHINGYTQPSLNSLHTLVVSHGGGFMQYLDGKTTVTHIVASNLTPKKAVEYKRYRIVKPAWIVDSVNEGRLLPWHNYRVVDEGVGQKVISIDSGKMTGRANIKERSYRDQSDQSWYTKQLKHDGHQDHDTTPLDNSSNERHVSAGEEADVLPELAPTAASTREPSHDGDKQAAVGNIVLVSTQASSDSYGFADEDALKETLEQLEGQAAAKSETASSSRESTCIRMETSAEDAIPESNNAGAEMSPTNKKKSSDLTAEEHNAILLSNPHIRKTSAVNPEFLQQYYRESRLHHLSTWKADLKSQLQNLAAEKTPCQRGARRREPGSRTYIMHVDFDSFFAAVSVNKHPECKGLSVVIAHGRGTGSEIASCNYKARAYGVKNGMWMKKALELCPELKVLPYDFPAYEEASKAFYEAVLSIDGVVQSVSIDEALVDITELCIGEGDMCREQNKADEIARQLRIDIKKQTDCDVSVGIGANILLAKVALRKAKPAGQYQIRPEEVIDLLGRLDVQELPGVAWSLGAKLEELGVKRVQDLRTHSKERLMTMLGPKTGEKLWGYARGIDGAEVGEQSVRKSVSAEVNWGIRFVTQIQADEFVENLCEELSKRLVKEGVKGRQLTMKIMRRARDAPVEGPKKLGHGKCDSFSKSVALARATEGMEAIAREALAIFRGFGFSPGELRGIGLQMTKLVPAAGSDGSRGEGGQQRLQFRQCRTESDGGMKDDGSGSGSGSGSSLGGKGVEVMGTQFLIPTQVDAQVLSELPAEVRARLSRRSTSAGVEWAESGRSSTSFSPSPQRERQRQRQRQRHGATTRGARCGSGRLAGVRAEADNTTLTQANFVSAQGKPACGSGAEEWPVGVEEIDTDFLAALPEDIRSEVLTEQRRRAGSADTGTAGAVADGGGAAERPTFSTRRLSALGEVRTAVSAWVGAFRAEGPYGEDVEALAGYLAAVVEQEGNMDKAVAVARWMEWEVHGGGGHEGASGRRWEGALKVVSERVQRAVSGRAVGVVMF